MTEQTTEGQRLCGCGRPVGDDDIMCAEHRALWDADAELQAWTFAESILRPWVESTRAIGSDELTYVMEHALQEVEAHIEMARPKVVKAEAALEE